MGKVKSPIAQDAYSASCDLSWHEKFWELDVEPTRNYFTINNVSINSIAVIREMESDEFGNMTGVVNAKVIYKVSSPPDSTSHLLYEHFAVEVPYYLNGQAEVAIHYSVTSDSPFLSQEWQGHPLGEKGVTHAKECSVVEEWVGFDGASSHVVCTVSGGVVGSWDGWNFTEAEDAGNVVCDATVWSLMTFWALGWSCQADFWGDYGKYAVLFSNMQSNGGLANLNGVPAYKWHQNPDFWAEGDGASFGLWGPNYDICGGQVSGTIYFRTPFSHAFNYYCRWMDGTDCDPIVYCTAIRRLNVLGNDIGPWKGRLSALRDGSPWVQSTGINTADTKDADVWRDMALYIDKNDAKLLGIEVGLPDADYKVEGAGFGVHLVDNEYFSTSPVDGGYTQDGAAYTNGQFWMFEWRDGWGIGPSVGQPPYYVTWDGEGPGGIYFVNEDDYTDSYNEVTGLWIFALIGEGIGPAVSTESGRRIVDATSPDFAHDMTMLLSGWGPQHGSRTESPYHNDIVTVKHLPNIGIYQNAHDATSWEAEGCTVPVEADDAGTGAFTIEEAGATLRLNIASNYISRNLKVGGEDQIPAPTCYRVRVHDGQLGSGVPPEQAEAVYDWSGWGYLRQSFKVPEQAKGAPLGTVVCRISYYYDLNGIGDNHLTDSTRQTEYRYDPGELYTIERTVDIIWKNTRGWSPVLIDLLDKDLPNCALVQSIEWQFGLTGDYLMDEPLLVNDPGDPQKSGIEGTDVTIGSRANGTNLFGGGPAKMVQVGRKMPRGDGGYFKMFNPYTYSQGGLSGHYNGVHVDALKCPDWAKANALEHTVGMLSVVFGAETGLDMTSCWGLGAFMSLVNGGSGDAWVGNYDNGKERAVFLDVNGDAIKGASAFDIVDSMNGELNVCVQVASWIAVPGIPYTWYGTHYVGGQVHGIAFDPDTGERVRRGTKGIIPIQRTVDTEEPKTYGFFDGAKFDDHGHYESLGGAVVNYPPGKRSGYWEYALLGMPKGYISLGRLATREFNAHTALFVPSFPRTLQVDQYGNIFSFWVDKSSKLWYKVKRWVAGKWSSPRILKQLEKQPTMLQTEKQLDGTFNVLYSDSDAVVKTLVSHTDYDSHVEHPVAVTLDWEPKISVEQGSFRYIVGYKEGQWKLARFVVGTNARSKFHDGTEEKFVAAGTQAIAGITATATALFIDIPTALNQSQLYSSLDGGETWHQDAQ
ncbi:MAG: hypothetical protein ACYC63_04850 [Armatimonadota bacterium]